MPSCRSIWRKPTKRLPGAPADWAHSWLALANKESDLALLGIGVTGLALATLDDAEDVQPWDFVLALGNALGIGQSVSFGVVSAMHRPFAEIHQDDLIEIDAALRPGNSGGPLVNLRGELIGINTARSDRTGAERGFGFAVPINQVRSMLLQLPRVGIDIPTLHG